MVTTQQMVARYSDTKEESLSLKEQFIQKLLNLPSFLPHPYFNIPQQFWNLTTINVYGWNRLSEGSKFLVPRQKLTKTRKCLGGHSLSWQKGFN